MPRKPTSKAATPRKRRTAEDARTAILDAAERLLVAAGPSGIRLQEVAADVGVSHPTVLHHFGSREGLVKAVVARALDSLHEGLLAAVQASPEGPDQIAGLLETVFETLVSGGHARAFFWLALSGYEPTIEQLHVRSLAEAVHSVRRTRRAQLEAQAAPATNAKGTSAKAPALKIRPLPPFEDTYFTVLLPALSLLAMSVTLPTRATGKGKVGEEALCEGKKFRAWLAKRIHEHLENG
jgi:AcrR family transcriptional regulator